MFKEGAWRLLDPVDQNMVLGLLVGSLLALLMRQLPWIAVGVAFGIAFGHLIGRRNRHNAGEHALNSDPVPNMGPYKEETPEHRVERLRGGVDKELSAALKAHREAWRQYREDRRAKPGNRCQPGMSDSWRNSAQSEARNS